MYTIKLLLVAVLFALTCASPYNFFSQETFTDPSSCSRPAGSVVSILDVCFQVPLIPDYMYYSQNGSIVESFFCRDPACKECRSVEQFTIGKCEQRNGIYVYNNVSMGAFPAAAKQGVSVFYSTPTCTNNTADIYKMELFGACSAYSCYKNGFTFEQQWCGTPDFLA